MNIEFIKKQAKMLEEKYPCIGIENNARYYDVRFLGCKVECVKVTYRNNEPINMTFIPLPIELFCKTLKFGGF